MIGTYSLKRTLLHVYNIVNQKLITEVRRGAESPNVNFISFEISKKFFVVVSDRKNIHNFFLTNIMKLINQMKMITLKKKILKEIVITRF